LSKLTTYHLLVSILFLAMMFPSSMPGHAAPNYSAGVTVGQWASYSPLNVTYHSTNIPEPQLVKDLNQTVQSTVTIQKLNSPTNVTVKSVSHFKDATVKTAILNGNLTTGAGNLTYALIAGGLSQPEPIWTKPLAPSINQTISMYYLGTPRTVNISNFTMPITTLFGVATSRQELVWDQTSGIIFEAKILVFLSVIGPLGGFVEYTHVRIDATNIFYNPNSRPSFSVTATSPASVTSGNTATSTLTVIAINGFTGTVALTDTVPAGLACDAITPSTVVGSGTARLSCISTIPGTYTVTIKATSGTTSHTTTTTITIAEVPSRTPSAPATIFGLAPTIFYVIIGVIILAIAGTGAYLVLRPKPKETTAQPAPTTP
jgi:hypothetical protein